MATGRDYDIEGRGLIPPYGPSRGMLQALHLLRRTTPTRIDSDLLRVNKIAPGNEYKVVGALRYLDLIDDDGKPTENSRLLKTKGATYTLALQDIVRKAYSGIFRGLKPNEITREGIYNHFVTEGGLGAEMATKATRFLVKLCRMAEIELAPESPRGASRGRKRAKAQPQPYIKSHAEPGGRDLDLHSPTQVVSGQFPMVLAMTPEMASMSVEQLTELFRKMRLALEQSSPSKN
jgi:Family of unknown function (DUF5343)